MARLWAIGLIAMFMGLASGAAPAAAQTGRMLQIHGRQACIDVANGNFTEGAQLIVWRCQGSPNQYFLLQDDGHLVANGGNPNSAGQSMCVTTNGVAIVLQRCHRLTTGDRQYWVRNGWGFIQNNHRGGVECIALPSVNDSPGTPLVVGDCADNQRASWAPYPYTTDDQALDIRLQNEDKRLGRFGNSEPGYDPEIRSSWEDNVARYGPRYKFRDRRTGLCLTAGQLLGSLALQPCTQAGAWFHLNAQGNLAEVTNRSGYPGLTGRCLTSPSQQGALAAFTACNAGSGAQRWWIHNDYGQVQNQATGLCLDVKNDARAAGSPIIVWQCNASRPANQAFGILRQDRYSPGS